MISFGSEERDLFCVDYRLTSKCNYNCWYCTDMHNNDRKDDQFEIKGLQNLIKALNRDIRFFLYGGEPTIHPDFLYAVEGILDALERNSILEIQTNLSVKKEKFQFFCDRINGHRKTRPVFFLTSYHYTECDFEDFFNNCVIANRYKMLDQIAVMYQDDYRTDIIKNLKILRKIFPKVKTELLPLLCGSVKENSPRPYEDIDKFYNCPEALNLSKNDFSFIDRLRVNYCDGTHSYVSSAYLWKNRQNSFNGMLCDVGKERIVIDSNGDCYRCFNQIFDETQKAEHNIFSKKECLDFLQNMKSITCTYDKCFFDFNHYRYY